MARRLEIGGEVDRTLPDRPRYAFAPGAGHGAQDRAIGGDVVRVDLPVLRLVGIPDLDRSGRRVACRKRQQNCEDGELPVHHIRHTGHSFRAWRKKWGSNSGFVAHFVVKNYSGAAAGGANFRISAICAPDWHFSADPLPDSVTETDERETGMTGRIEARLA